jgi:hypothetical protein
MPFVSGYLRIRDRGLHPEHGLPPGSPGAPDQGLPEPPPYPDQGLPGMEYPDQGLPLPPPGVWPPPTISHPIIPAPPGTPPGAIWPPPTPAYPWLPPTGAPGEPAHPIQPVPPGPAHPIATPPDKFWIVAGIPGYGWRYVCVEPQAGHPIVYPPPGPDQGLPPGSPGSPAHPIDPVASPRR